MIRITKGPNPISLTRAAARINAQNNQEFVNHQAEYLNGDLTFEFSSAYRSDSVKVALTRDQFGKCCFSEARFVADEAHVEHFRPKGRIDSWPNGPYIYPGYYWLAYEYSNLFFCKSILNSSHKRNYFPLVDEALRNRSHLDTNVEASVLINPAEEDPRDHIRFVNEEIKGITDRGKLTINILNLRHPQLYEARREILSHLYAYKLIVETLVATGSLLTDEPVATALHKLRDAVTPQAQFSSMAIDFLTGWPHL